MELPRNKALHGGYKKTPESKKEIVTNASLFYAIIGCIRIIVP